MGIGEQRRREAQEESMENRRMKEEAEGADTLVGLTAPKTKPLLSAISTNMLPLGEKTVRPRVSSDGEWVEFLNGETVCGRVQVDIAQDAGSPLDATYFEVLSDDDDVLKLRAQTLDRRSLRPQVEDEDD
jgi:hypothetical protein